MMREYTVFNVDQRENVADCVKTVKPARVRNPTVATSLPTTS